MEATLQRETRGDRGDASGMRAVVQSGLAIALLSASVTPLRAQPSGAPLAPPVVHELRANVPALSRTTLNAPNAAGDGFWMSSIDAVTNVAIDVLLLAPSAEDSIGREVQIRDADGVLRRWSDGPIIVARALMPGRHRVSMRWGSATLNDGDYARVAAGMRTATRASETVPLQRLRP
jgi:hypothetical protein